MRGHARIVPVSLPVMVVILLVGVTIPAPSVESHNISLPGALSALVYSRTAKAEKQTPNEPRLAVLTSNPPDRRRSSNIFITSDLSRSSIFESSSRANLFDYFLNRAFITNSNLVAGPNVTSLSPSSAIAGGAGFTLAVIGTGFASNFVIRINGFNRTTTFVNSTRLTTPIAASEIATAGTFPVTVFNPNTGGGESAPLTFTINNLLPTASSLAPTSAPAAGAAFTLTVTGTNLVSSTIVNFGGTSHAATLIDATHVSAVIATSEIPTVGTVSVTVTNPPPAGGTSSPPLTFTINRSLSPSSAIAGGPGFTLTVNDTGFAAGFVIRINGVDRITTFVDSTKLTTPIDALEIVTAGTFSVTVFNPVLVVESAPLIFTINNPVPTATSLSTTSAPAGGAAFTLTVTGTNFVSSSTINFGATNHTTTFIDGTQVSAVVAASEIAVGATIPVTVTNPIPGGGTSTPALTFTVNNPVPTTSSLSPTSAPAGGAAFTLTVTGTNFVSSSIINFGGTSHTTTLIDATHVSAVIATSEIAVGATIPVTVTNPAPSGGISTPALTFTVNNPVPTTSSLSPTSAIAGGAAFTLTVTGTNFVSSSIINFGGTNHTVNLIDATHVSATIAASEIATAGTVSATVTNPTPSGGTSTPALTFTVNNPLPTVSTISPTTKAVGDAAFTLTVNGTNFNASSVVRFNGGDRPTTLVNTTQVTAQLTAADVAAAGTYPITLFNPTPGGGLSNAVNLTVNNLVPTIVAPLSPASVTAGGIDFTLTVNGTNYVAGSVVRINAIARATTFVSSTQLTATILAADIALAGAFPITVFNPAPGGGTSNAVNLTVNPSLTTISPATVRAGGIGFTLTVNGAGFVAGSVVRFNGSNRATTFLNATQLSASILATDIPTVGTFPITVATPGGQTSNAVNLTVIPSVNIMTPLTEVAGDPAFTLTVDGGGFVSGSVVRWNGSSRTTTFVSATRLTAAITAADIAAVGAFPITVLNPAPTNLASNSINFTVSNAPPGTECPLNSDVTLASPGLINGGSARAQMWRTAADSTWWGVFSNNTDGIYFYRQTSPTTWVQGPLVDTNIVAGVFVAGSPDCLWNGTNLFVMVQESQLVAKLYKYTYNSGTQTYTVVSGFPISLPLVGVGTSSSGKSYGAVAIDQDSTGKLWAAYTGGGVGGDGNVRVISSTSADHKTWDTTGTIIESGISTLKVEASPILAFGGNKIGVSWSNQNTLEYGFRFHNNADPVGTWSTKEVIDSGLGPMGFGGVASNAMTMKTSPDGRIFLVANDNDGGSNFFNHLYLYVRPAAGGWGQKTLVVNDFNAGPSKPVLLLDTDNNELDVVYKDGAVGSNGLSGQTFITQSSMNNPAFNTPCILIDTSDSLVSTSNPTSTKQNVNATTDLVVACSTGRKNNAIFVNSIDVTPNAVTIFTLSPKEVTAGESASALTLTVNGKLFVKGPPSSIVRRSGVNKTTTYVNAGKLTASLPTTDTATAGSYPITVINPDSSVSNAVNLVVTATNPVPAVTIISPNRELVGSLSFTITITGTGFRRTSVVKFNGASRTTTFVNDTKLTATILASDLLVAGPYPITVTNPTPGGGTSAITKASTFFVEPPCPISSPTTFTGLTVWNTNKAQMWYNDGLWWGAFSDNAAGVYFYKNTAGSFVKGAQLDSNLNGHPDVLWNGFNLFVLVYEFNTQAKLYKYTYDSTTKLYTIVSGFPVTMPLIGIGTGTTQSQAGSITLAQDSTGKLWGAYPGTGPGGDRNYRVIWSTSADHKVWDTNGFILDTGGATVTQEVMSIVAFQGNKIGITWSNQVAVELGFRYHNDGDLENVWSTKEVIDFGLGNEIGIGGVADNHESIKAAPDGRIFLVQKDSDGNGYIHLYIRSTAGVWTANPILVDIDPQAKATRPTLLLDLENSDVYVVYDDANQSLSYLSHTSMNTPLFGPSCPFVTQTFIDNLTSTKQNLKASMGLTAVGSTQGAASEIYANSVTLVAGSGNLPVLTSISPTGAGFGSTPITVTLTGTNFASGAVVYFNGYDRPTTFVSATQLTARIFASDLATLGTYPITVMNPRGGTSAAVNLVVNPNISTLSPASATAGAANFTLTVNGTGFVSGAVVKFNGVSRTTTFVNSTQLTAQILAADVATAGLPPVTVTNPGASGGTSAASTFTVNNPVPTVTSAAPTSVIVGGAAFTLTVNGTNFNSSSIVQWNGLSRATTFVNATQLTAQILATDIATTGSFPVTVFMPTPGGGTSLPASVVVNNPAPTLTSTAPTSKTAGDVAFVLTVNGTNFNSSSVVQFNGAARTTTFVNATQVTAQITAADVATAGTPAITVFNPAPGGGTSAASTLTVNNPLPTLTSIAPTSKIAGDVAFVLTVNGTNYNSSSVVQFDGAARTTTFVNATQLTAQITAADVAAAGTPAITVFNPAPGGGTSAASTLTVNNPLPTLTSIAPTSKIAGDVAFVLTANGTSFNSSSVVQFNGTARTTTFVNATQLTAQITAADVAPAGTPAITVFNPAPGGGTSAASTLTVNNPLPTLTSIAPTSKIAGDAAFVLTVNGTNYNSSSIVRFNGVDRTTTLVNANQLTAQITAADVAAAGTPSITVFNPAPSGGTSAANTLTVNNPLPTLTSIAPTSKIAGDIAFILTVNGTNFNSSSVVQFNGAARTTTFVDATQLTAQITAADVATAGTPAITAFNPAPGGGTSAASTLTVNNPLPTLTSIAPSSKIAGDAAFTMTVTGTNFVAGSVVRLNGNNRSTTFVNANQVTAQLAAADVAAAGTPAITVFNPAPGGGTSAASTLTINNPLPTLTSIAPTSKTAGDVAFVLIVNGTNFNSSSVVQFNGTARTTTLVNATQLTAQITAADVAAAGTPAITVFNPAPGGGTSAASTLTVNNPLPTLTSIAPTSKIAGDAAFVLTVNGTNFNSSSIVRYNGVDRTTTLVNATQVTAQITATDVAAAGTPAITVFNPAPGGGTSAPSTLTVNNPLPTLTSIAPTSKIAGDVAFVLTVNGTNFNSSSVVQFDGAARTTTFVNATQLTAQITATDVAPAGTPAITVFNPAPGGGTSAASTLTVNNPLPTLTSIAPTSKIAGDAAFGLTVNGTNYNSSSIVRFNGADRTTTFVNATQVTAQITAADVATAGTPAITVLNPAPGGGTSAASTLTVNNPLPTLTSITPSSKIAGDIAFVLTVNGTNFNSSSVVQFNGAARATTFVNATQVTAQITAADVAAAGTPAITVFNPAPGGGTSAASTLTVNNPLPTLTSIAPTSKTAGDVAFVLTVNGTNFNSSSVVQFNGTARTTTLVNATQLTAQITAADVAAAGTPAITVFNPAPGGGTSAASTLTVNNPLPTLTSIAPTSKIAGDIAFVLTVNGTNLNSSSVVQFNGTARTTTFVNATQLTAQITAADVAAAGTPAITVFNPAPGGGTSAASTLTVNNPLPTLTSIAPTSKIAGDAAFVLTVNGTNYNNSSIVRFNGVDRTTTLVNANQLTAQITAADIAAAGTLAITVFNPAPGGGTSAVSTLTINNPLPTLTSIAPTSKIAGDIAFVLTANGTSFNSSSVVQFNGTARTTTFVNATQLTAQITAADVATAGTPAITVLNPAPGGGTSAVSTLTINNPLPALTSITPSSKIAGDIAFVLTVNGTNFNTSSVVQFNGTARTTTFVNATQLTAQITAADVATAGTPAITVLNPAPGGGTSAASTLTVNNPLPTLTSIAPTSKIAGDVAFVLTVNGTNFNSSSVVQFNGTARTTTLVNATQVTAQITAADVAAAGTPAITVFNPAPGGGTSAASTLTVNNPLPALTSIAPTSKIAGDIASVLTVNGTNFNNSSVVQFNGTARTTTFVNVSQVTAQITATDVATAGTPSITVFNPAPGGGTSAASTLTVNNPLPTLTSIAPTSKTAGDAAFVLTVNGTNFNSSSVVQFNGTARSTTFVNASQVTAQILAADVATAGSANITLINPTPGGGTSNAVNLTVNNPLPTVSTFAPNTTLEGSAGFTLTVNGSNFISSSVVQWNGQPRTTGFVSSTQLTAQITAADVATAGSASVLVNTPAPGGGTSGTLTFQITNNARSVRVVNSSGSANTTVTVPIQLTAQGDENALGFSLNFDTSLLSNPTATLGSDAAGASLNLNTTQVAQGHCGVALALPTGQSFVAGTRNIVTISFTTAAVAIQTTAPLAFGDQPIAREIADSVADTLPAGYAAGTVTITLGYEADVAPRPNGSNNGTVSIADWSQTGRFAAGFDTAANGSEFQRADSAPKSTSGNGAITISDWVQAGRYASGLDPVQAAGGPTAPPSGLTAENAALANRPEAADLGDTPRTTVRLTGTPLPAGQPSSLTIDFQALGNENAFGFSLMFDPAKLKFLAAEKSGEASLATLNVNKLEAADGRLGIAIALPAGKNFSAGAHQLVVLTFTSLADIYDTPAIGFTDRPIAREVVDVNANNLKASFMDSSALGVNPIDDLQFFVVQHYLDFLNRTPDSSGLDYWTQQLKQCGNDAACLRQRRIDVSAAFFIEQEFQQTGYVVYRLYRAAYAQRPSYAQFVADRGLLFGGPQLPASTLEFANQFVSRAEFKLAYPDSLTPNDFVNKLFQSAALAPDPAKRQQAIQALTAGTKSRAQVLLELSDSQELKDREYNPAFVLMQYFGYLKRDPDQAGYDFWLNLLNNNQTANYRGMVCAFISSREYQQRFSSVVTHTDQDCGP